MTVDISIPRNWKTRNYLWNFNNIFICFIKWLVNLWKKLSLLSFMLIYKKLIIFKYEALVFPTIFLNVAISGLCHLHCFLHLSVVHATVCFNFISVCNVRYYLTSIFVYFWFSTRHLFLYFMSFGAQLMS